jgi:CBS domain-containing protein
MAAMLARDVMTANPVSCAPHTPLDEVARLMLRHDCGEIPVVGASHNVIGVITDRDIVCRIVAQRENPMNHSAEGCMTTPVVTVRTSDTLEGVLSVMEQHQLRRVPVIDEQGGCVGMIAQADLAQTAAPAAVAELVREVSRD